MLDDLKLKHFEPTLKEFGSMLNGHFIENEIESENAYKRFNGNKKYSLLEIGQFTKMIGNYLQFNVDKHLQDKLKF